MARGPQMIAMMGDPCTGKSKLANSIAAQLRCPVFDLDDVRNSIASLTKALPDTTSEEDIDNRSFDSICQLALPLLQSGFNVIIDSPLSSRGHLDRLLQLISSSPGSRLVIVEFKPRDRFKWRQWVEQRGTSNNSLGGSWYKPSTWDDLQELLNKSGGSSVYDTKDVPKLVVNTTEIVRAADVTLAVKRLLGSRTVYCIDLHVWMDKLAKGLIDDKGAGERSEAKMFKPGDDIGTHYFHYHELQKQSSVSENGQIMNCRGCLKPIAGPAYKCKECKLSLHISCTELPSRKEIKPREYLNFLKETPHKYLFPETIKCGYCGSHDDIDFNECPECLFEAFIRGAELPSVLHHPCHEHPLCILIVPISFRTEFLCKACGDHGKNIRYHCFECGFECHLTCGLLPHTLKQKRHLHLLNITFFRHQANSEEEFLCDACETYRNPEHWIYYCRNCEFASHLSCMTFD